MRYRVCIGTQVQRSGYSTSAKLEKQPQHNKLPVESQPQPVTVTAALCTTRSFLFQAETCDGNDAETHWPQQ